MTPCLRESHMKGLSSLTQYVMWKYLIHPPISLWQSLWKGGTLILYLALTKPSLSKVIPILLLFNQQIVLCITPSRLLKGPQAWFLTRNIYCGAITLV